MKSDEIAHQCTGNSTENTGSKAVKHSALFHGICRQVDHDSRQSIAEYCQNPLITGHSQSQCQKRLYKAHHGSGTRHICHPPPDHEESKRNPHRGTPAGNTEKISQRIGQWRYDALGQQAKRQTDRHHGQFAGVDSFQGLRLFSMSCLKNPPRCGKAGGLAAGMAYSDIHAFSILYAQASYLLAGTQDRDSGISRL